MTDGILSVATEWTGTNIAGIGCPWRVFFDPFVQRVLDAYRFYDKGQLGTHAPNISHRVIEGVAHYARTANAIEWKRMELEREEFRRKAAGSRP